MMLAEAPKVPFRAGRKWKPAERSFPFNSKGLNVIVCDMCVHARVSERVGVNGRMSLCVRVTDTVGAVRDVNRGLKQERRESSLSLIYANYITVYTNEST